jgi:DNA mismatch repair protein MutS
LDDVPEVRDRILNAISEEPPANLADGGTIRSGFNAELDELRDISRNSRQYIAQIESRERGRTAIQSLKVRFNNVFGYYIEISKANLHLAPTDYERKQTLVNAERFTTPELKELESKILDARASGRGESLYTAQVFRLRRDSRPRRTAPGDREAGREGRDPLHTQRSVLRHRIAVHRRDHRPQHGR